MTWPMRVVFSIFLSLILFIQSGCATHTQNLLLGMVAGAGVGAMVGQEFENGGDPGIQSRNVIMSSILLALIIGGVMEWHYKELEAQEEQISGRYARFRLCDPELMKSGVEGQLDLTKQEKVSVLHIDDNQIEKASIRLDDNTKWAFPVFRKRYLLPELGESQMTSERYIWEIIKPGSFVTRSQNPLYFFQTDKK